MKDQALIRAVGDRIFSGIRHRGHGRSIESSQTTHLLYGIVAITIRHEIAELQGFVATRIFVVPVSGGVNDVIEGSRRSPSRQRQSPINAIGITSVKSVLGSVTARPDPSPVSIRAVDVGRVASMIMEIEVIGCA